MRCDLRGCGASSPATNAWLERTQYWLETQYQHDTRRSVLEKALAVFPNNTILLSTYVCIESRSQMTARLRRYLHSWFVRQGSW